MARLHIFRHGQTEWNLEGRMQGHKGSPLSTLGKRQAIEARAKVDSVRFDSAFCSTSERALETAELLLEGQEVHLHQRDELREIHLGVWEGMLQEEVKSAYPAEHHNFWKNPGRYTPVGGESFSELQTRALSITEQILDNHSGKTILLVSHAGFIKALMSLLAKRPLELLWEAPYAENLSHSIIQKNKSSGVVIEKFCDEPWDEKSR